VINLVGICKSFGPRCVLRDVSLSFEPGRAYGLCGKNGSGKTTLLRIVSGMTAPDRGTVRVLDQDPAVAWSVRRHMGIVEDADVYFPELTVREFLWWVSRIRLCDGLPVEQAIDSLLERINLADRAEELVGALSHGMRRRVYLASAFVGRPPILLLDEPTVGLDHDSLDILVGLILDHRREGLVVCASHDRDFVARACTDVLTLQEGGVGAP
jgi:ABC-type multidrug transport system ATPase subunit